MEQTPLLTVAEATHYTKTSRHQDVLAFCDALTQASPLVHRTTLGKSGEGQDLVALVISDRNCFTPELARRQKKMVVLVEANIHAGEVEGKESVLALIRDLTVGRPKDALPRKKDLAAFGKKLLRTTVLVVVPDFNPDGNDRISVKNRALDLQNLEGQVNPEGGVGMRYTGEGWNLNRDNMKHEAPETRAMAAFYQAWWPHLFIDCHTTDGSLHTYDLTYDTSRGNHAVFAPVRDFARAWLERVAASVKQDHGFDSFWYGNFLEENDPTTGWHTYPALPRFGSHHRGLLGRLDVLLETYSYIGYQARCDVIYAWLLELLKAASRDGVRIQKLLGDMEKRTLARGKTPDPRDQVAINHGVARRDDAGALLFSYPAYALDGDVAVIKGFDRDSMVARRYPGKKRATWRVPHHRSFVPTASVSVPVAYLAPPLLAERLQGHGVSFQVLSEDTTVPVESYRILAMEQTFSPDVAAAVPPPGEAEVPLSQRPPPKRFETVLTVRAEQRVVTAKKGWLYVPTAQRAGILAVYLLEPHSDDGLARWQFLDGMCAVGQDFPVHRVVSHVKVPVKVE